MRGEVLHDGSKSYLGRVSLRCSSRPHASFIIPAAHIFHQKNKEHMEILRVRPLELSVSSKSLQGRNIRHAENIEPHVAPDEPLLSVTRIL